MDDWQLLDDYAARNSEDAFRALVDRYAGMVYHAALRQVGRPQAAEEATQAVFIALAQKAGKIRRQPTLYGWLFRATRFAVLNSLRDEAARRRHEQEAIAMQQSNDVPDCDSIWEQISPHLNDALERLSESDREAIMIRFFGNKSHQELGRALGISEDTAKKRVSRAIDKLRVIFTKRGLVVPSVALVAALSAYGAQAAPVGLGQSVAAIALAKGTVATASSFSAANAIVKLMAWAKIKPAFLLGTGLILAAGTTATIMVAQGTSNGDVISLLEKQSGERIVCDKHITIPPTFDPKGKPLEAALDQLCVEAGAYWTMDYTVYDSDWALKRLLDASHEGMDLSVADWTNLSSRPLQANISMVSGDTHGRSRGMLRMAMRGEPEADSVAMTVVLSPDAAAKFMRPPSEPPPSGGAGMVRADDDVVVTSSGAPPPHGGGIRMGMGGGQPPPIFQLVNQAMRDGVTEGVLAPERLLSDVQLLPNIDPHRPLPATEEAVKRIAKAAHANWTKIYTVRKSPVEGAGIKLVHAGHKQVSFGDVGEGPHTPDALMSGMRTNAFNLSSEDKSAHDRAVAAWKQSTQK